MVDNDKLRIKATDRGHSKQILADTLGSIDDEGKPIRTSIMHKTGMISDSSSVRTLQSY